MRRRALWILGWIAPTVLVLGAVEAGLRLGLAAPTGYFDFLLPPRGTGLYPPGIELDMAWGPFEYTVGTNRLGLRRTADGPRPRDRGRIGALGDSLTNGFFVDDEASYPWILQSLLDAELGRGYEVLNLARGGGSLPKELAILERIAIPLEPSVAILTFVTNDIIELTNASFAHMNAKRLDARAEAVPFWEHLPLWLATRTALGETLLRLYWDHFIRQREPPPATAGGGEQGYDIPGGMHFAANSRRFLRRHRHADSKLLVGDFDAETEALVERYLDLLDRFVALCRGHEIAPVLVYFPAYPQIYDPGVPRTIRDVLARRAKRLDLPFLDLTPVFAREGADRPLHLAPLDFHLSPAGNRVMARAIFEFLRSLALVR